MKRRSFIGSVAALFAGFLPWKRRQNVTVFQGAGDERVEITDTIVTLDKLPNGMWHMQTTRGVSADICLTGWQVTSDGQIVKS